MFILGIGYLSNEVIITTKLGEYTMLEEAYSNYTGENKPYFTFVQKEIDIQGFSRIGYTTTEEFFILKV